MAAYVRPSKSLVKGTYMCVCALPRHPRLLRPRARELQRGFMPSINVVLHESIWKRKYWLMYLVIADDFFDKHQINVNVTPEFEAATFKYAKAYIEKGEMPPADIAPAILNMADDFMAGRQVAVRAGDYIAVHNHLRGAAGAKK
jgi:hypothetical protein